jgi:hypothetical protein
MDCHGHDEISPQTPGHQRPLPRGQIARAPETLAELLSDVEAGPVPGPCHISSFGRFPETETQAIAAGSRVCVRVVMR